MTVRKPQPPASFRSPEPRTLEDLRKLTTYLREQNAWLEYQIANAGGGGGAGVTSFKGRTGVVVPAAGDYTKSDVGLSNVTNDAQWASTLSAQVSALTAKTSLVDADVVPIEDSAASFGKKKVTAGLLRTYTGNPYIDPPASPHADNDEFNSYTHGGAWSIWDRTGAAVPTAVNSIDPYTFPAAGTYRWAIRGSWLHLQFPKNANDYLLYKAVTVPATGALAFGRVCCWTAFNGNQVINASRNIAVGFWQNSAGRPSTTAPNFMSIVNTGVSNRFLQMAVAGSTSASAQNTTGQVATDILGMFLRTSPSNLAMPIAATTSGDVNTTNNTSVFTWTGTMAYTGFQFNMNADATSALCPIVAIDYFRRVDSATAWIV